MRINRALINGLSKNGQLRYLAVFIRLKSVYSNSCVFNYDHRSFSTKTELSPSSVNKYVKFFLKAGWAYMDGRNLEFKKLKKISWCRTRDYCKVEGTTVKEILSNLYLQLLKHKVNQSKWYTQMCLDLQQTDEIRRKKLMKKVVRWEKGTGRRFSEAKGLFMLKVLGNTSGFKLSFDKISEWFNCGLATAHKIIHKLSKEGKLTICFGGWNVYHKRKPGDGKSFISKSGHLVRFNSNSYLF